MATKIYSPNHNNQPRKVRMQTISLLWLSGELTNKCQIQMVVNRYGMATDKTVKKSFPAFYFPIHVKSWFNDRYIV